jgi:hypothetical protein
VAKAIGLKDVPEPYKPEPAAQATKWVIAPIFRRSATKYL